MQFDLHFDLNGSGVFIKSLTSLGREYFGPLTYVSISEARDFYQRVIAQGLHVSFENVETRDSVAVV